MTASSKIWITSFLFPPAAGMVFSVVFGAIRYHGTDVDGFICAFLVFLAVATFICLFPSAVMVMVFEEIRSRDVSWAKRSMVFAALGAVVGMLTGLVIVHIMAFDFESWELEPKRIAFYMAIGFLIGGLSGWMNYRLGLGERSADIP